MASTSQRPEGHDGVLQTLDVFIQVANTAKDTCGIPPAQVAFGSASALLTVIRVRFLLQFKDGLLNLVSPGYDGQRPGFRQPRPGLR